MPNRRTAKVLPTMKNIPNQPKILLVGNHLRQLEKMLDTFRETGFELLFAADVREAFRVTRRNRPNLIISEFALPGSSGLDLCRMVRRDSDLQATAFVFFSQKHQQSENIREASGVGADDCFAEFFTPEFIAAKASWLIKRKSSEEALNQHYQILRQNQSQILDLIKQTSELLDNMDYRRKTEKPDDVLTPEFENFMNKKLELGLGMIGALANLVDDQAKALDLRENSLRGEAAISQKIKNEINAQCFYEISYN